ncbi:MAG: ABC-F family ATP-binding cassette domain-containing protein [Candidatus Paceibacterota bacterium]|jgi:ATPase subunit of ABC transporter with duplicated ATPase domains
MLQNKPIISVTNLSKSFDNFVVFKHANFSIQQGEKIGLIGSNGSGKSTLLKILNGLVKQDEGHLTVSKEMAIGYIPQEFDADKDQLVKDILKTKLNQSEIISILEKLKIGESMLDRPIVKLSGGEKTKVALARIFLSKHNFLLLDEPTNNLDIEGLELLEKFVKESDKTFLIVSHDREFLDRTVNRIFEIDEVDRKLRIYDGNFSSYLQTRHARIEQEWAEYNDNVEKKIHLEKTVEDKLRRADKISRAELRDKDKMQGKTKIEWGQKIFQRGAKLLKNRLENMENTEKPKIFLPLNINFEIEERSGDKVLELISITKNMPDQTLGPIDLVIQYGDKILITGENGSGKTTLLKMIMRQTSPDKGEIKYGTNLKIGYLPQQEDFVSEAKVKDEFIRLVKIEEGTARKILNRFKLSTEDVNKKIRELSSGERSRLIIAIIMAQKVNCLILDEPSNHLDLQVLESLEYAVKNFKGTLILVSHDRYFIKQIAPLKSFVIKNGKIIAREILI